MTTRAAVRGDADVQAPLDGAFGPPAHPVLALFPRMSSNTLAGLVASIAERGLQEPIVLFEGSLVDGRERLEACRAAGVEPSFREWSGDGDVADWILDANLRRDLTPSQRAALAVLWDGRGQLEADAQARVLRGTRAPDGARVGRTSAQLGLRFGASARQVERAMRVTRENRSLLLSIREGALTLNQAEARVELAGARAVVAAFDRQLPTGLFTLVMVDPPWPEPGVPYPTQSVEEIQALGLPLADEAVVLLWTTQRFLPDAFGVLAAWHLAYLRTKM